MGEKTIEAMATSAPASTTTPIKPKRKAGPKPRRIPQRTCIACKQARPKRELIRVVRTPEGHVELDPTGKKSGRGAYLCAKRSCWEPALQKGKIEREFELTLLPEDRAALEAFADTLPLEPAKATTSTRPTKTNRNAIKPPPISGV